MRKEGIYRWQLQTVGDTTKKIAIRYLQVVGPIHVANNQPRVGSVVDPVVAKCAIRNVATLPTSPHQKLRLQAFFCFSHQKLSLIDCR
jgi:hypothetical protein